MEIEKVQRDFTRLVENFGILPYKDRLKKLDLTTLLERRLRGDLIETLKIVTGKTKYGSNLFNMSRNGINLLFALSMQSSKCDFITNRVNYWNKLPVLVRKSENVQKFKANLEKFKNSSQNSTQKNYWDISDEIFDRINDNSRETYISYLLENPDIMKRRKITITKNSSLSKIIIIILFYYRECVDLELC